METELLENTKKCRTSIKREKCLSFWDMMWYDERSKYKIRWDDKMLVFLIGGVVLIAVIVAVVASVAGTVAAVADEDSQE